MAPDLQVSSDSDPSVDRVDEARRKIEAAMDGMTKEQCCATLAIVAIECGLYDSAQDLLRKAEAHREQIYRAGGRS